ncbi:MAG TPA: hypothetical protein VKY74_02780 [Chloroflexia bacterium]|nr:hypothetical protein [Chloroflexia bacterium]
MDTLPPLEPEEPAPDGGFAAIEDLDPEPPAPARHRWRVELLVGLLLVLGLAGAGGWQWWRGASQQAAYQAGTRAAAAQNWEAARSAFAAAAGYGDADGRAAAAAQTIAERDRQYGTAVAAAQQGDWATVLQAVARIRQIARGYRSSEALDAQADAHLPAAVLSGTLALRLRVTPPGLYRYGPRGWTWLQGSDAASRVAGFCPDGEVLFDAPAPPGAPPGPASLPDSPGPGRRLLRASASGTPRAALAFDLTTALGFECTRSGVWRWQQVPNPAALLQPPGPRSGLQVAFQALGSTQILTPTLPGPAWQVVGTAPDGVHLLVAETTGLAAAGRQVRLYLTGADGSGPQLLLTHTGDLVDNTTSPDGRYALLDFRTALRTSPEITMAIVLLDTTGGRPPRELVTMRSAMGANPSGGSAGFGYPIYRFVHQGAHTGQVFLSWAENGRHVVRLFDPARPAPLLAYAFPARVDYVTVLSVAGTQGGLLLDASSQQVDHSVAEQIAYIDADNHLWDIPARTQAGYGMGWARVGAGQLLYISSGTDSMSSPIHYTLTSLPLSQLAAPPQGAIKVYTNAAPAQPARFSGAPWHLGPGLLAYLRPDGVLHVRTFDGAVDMVLGEDVAGFFDPDVYNQP